MINHGECSSRTFNRARTGLSLCFALAAAACVSSPGGTGGEGGSRSGGSSSTGGSGSGGTSSTGGSGSGGTSSTGESGSGGTSSTGGSGSGGTSSTGGAGSGGTSSTGGAGGGGATDTGGSGSGGSQRSGTGGSGSGGSQRPGTGGSGGRTSTGSGGSASGGAGGKVATGGSSGTGGNSVPSTGAVPSAGCGKTSTLTFKPVPNQNANAAPGSGNTVGHGEGGYVTIQSGGGSRDFAMRLPDNYDKDHPYWLSFTFHPNGGNAYGVDNGGSNGYEMAYYGLQKRSNNGAIFVAPQGLGGAWANSGGQDLKFVDDMVKLIEDNYCVDTTHIFAQGFSYGGGMSYAIACARAKVFRGVAIYEGAQLSGCEGGTDPIALWQMVGLEDTVCGMGMATPIRDRFVKNNGCTTQNPPQPPKAPPYLNPGGHVCTDYAGCSAGHPVRWCVHQSGHGNAIVDGTGDLYNSCATAPKTCSTSCPCSWVPDDVWKWMTSF
jgi:poly(3-hydroxybutyrate) depolymerase